MRRLTHIKKLDDGFADFLIEIKCACGYQRAVSPEFLANLVGWSATLESLKDRVRCSQCGKKEADVWAIPKPRPRGQVER